MTGARVIPGGENDLPESTSVGMSSLVGYIDSVALCARMYSSMIPAVSCHGDRAVLFRLLCRCFSQVGGPDASMTALAPGSCESNHRTTSVAGGT